MIKKLLFLLTIFSASYGIAQDIHRVEVQGKVHVPEGEDSEGIGVYNVSSQKGTLTGVDGSFQIAVGKNDRLQIYALQYQAFTVVVDEGILDKRVMNIYLNPSITQLEEVVVRPSDLTGNIRVDIQKIPTYYTGNDFDLSYESMEFGYGFIVDEQTAIKGNAAEEALNINQLQHGINFSALFTGVADLLFPGGKKIDPKARLKKEGQISNNLQQRFSRKFVADNFDIPEDKAVDFLFFAQEKGLNDSMLKPENELVLMDFLEQKSREYKKRKE